ncbi:MAG: M28 family peptidase [Thermoleophilaceae bacterium]|nr:M28 family peptidase [Thermoleophilaceae bacterium]
MDALGEIDALCGIAGRAPGTDAERRAARRLCERLAELGRDAELQPIQVHPNWPGAHILHAFLAIAGSVVSVSAPVAGAALALAAAVSAFGDLSGMFLAVRRLTGRRASQNVVSREGGEKPGTFVLVAHYDAGRGSTLLGRAAHERRAGVARLIRRPIGPFEPFFWSIVVVLVCAALRVVGVEGVALTTVQFVPTVVLIASVPVLADIALSVPVPAANDNASGVATVLRLAERYGGALRHFDLWVLLPGAHHGLMLGMREWLRRNRRSLAPERTVFLEVTTVGAGTVRFTTREGLVVASPYHPTLIELCREIAAGDRDGARFGARALVSRRAGDAHEARTAGFPAISISCADALDRVPDRQQPTDTPDRIDPAALERAYEFCCELIERIDERLGPGLRAEAAPAP